MPSLDLLFAYAVAILAGACCIGALVVVLVREYYAIRETIRRHRKPGSAYDPTSRWWREHSAITLPERQP